MADSKKGLEEARKEIERLREQVKKKNKRIADLERRLSVHLNPNVPPSVENHAPGCARDRPLVPPEHRKRPGLPPGHEGVTREPLAPDRKVSLTFSSANSATCACCL